MAVREILQLGNLKLWDRSLFVKDVESPEIQGLTEDLRDTLSAFREANGFGRGIAASQIGVLMRVIYIKMEPPGFCGTMINPKIISQSRRRIELWDACFSMPNLMVRVSRASEIEVEYTDEQGERRSLKADGDLCELLQHEIDHLDGILMVHRAVSPRAFMTTEEWHRQGKPR